MAFDQNTRNRLQRFVGEARTLLTEEFTRQLQNVYGLNPDSGEITPLENMGHLDDARRETARILRDTLEHYRATSSASENDDLLERIVREQAFTVLNRLAALRMAEARGLLIESLGNGYNSKGFQLYSRLAGTSLGETGDAFRCYLFSIFDEFALDLKVLFDRFSPYGRLFPRGSTLLQLIGLMNDTEVAPLWGEDETIGWIYQYFNSKEERKKMRDESVAPRNSRELAVRNQFFTPRYVVEFLTDNTLGRIWYEMTHGETRLKDECRYMVCRSNEIFLEPGASPPETEKAEQNLSQEEMLRQPLYIPHRQLKDPRMLRVLDPACGSMHFGLYAYNLLEAIYTEAWELEAAQGADGFTRELGLSPLRETYENKESFLHDVPRLIIEHNLHGIDIDPRAVQIAGLSLWLRAQRAWSQQGVKPSERPQVRRSNIICAEPMPGERELLEEFIGTLPPDVPGALVRSVFDRMELAGEAGSLLRIEDDIRAPIAQAKQEWLERRRKLAELVDRPQGALGDFLQPAFEQPPLDFDFESITDEKFFDEIEDKAVEALREYAERATSGEAYARRLFADDAEEGFAFIDLLRKKFDVVLMNPPFGDASIPSKKYIDETYADTKGDVYKAFVEGFQDRLVPAGYLGIISSRTGFFLGQSEDWRTRVVLRLYRPIALADLGSGVLDATVEVAAYVLRSLSESEDRNLTLSLVPVLANVARDKQDRFSLPKWQAARNDLKRHQAVAELERLEAYGFIERCPGDIVRYAPLWREVQRVSAPPPPVYPPLVCVRAVEAKEKGDVISAAIAGTNVSSRFVCEPGDFASVPRSPFSYWVSARVREVFQSLPPFASDGREAWMGLSSGFDFQWVRLVWEVPRERCGRGTADTTGGKGWVPLAKGGEFSPYYGDLYLVVNWDGDGKALSDWKRAQFLMGRITENNSKCWNRTKYFRPGLTWSARSQIGLSFRAMPAGSIFGNKGPAAFADTSSTDAQASLLALFNSKALHGLVALQMAFGSFEVGVIQRTPIPRLSDADRKRLANLAIRAWVERRSLDTSVSTSHAFSHPALFTASGETLAECATAWAARVRTSEETVAAIQDEIDDLAFRLYGLDAADRTALTATLAIQATNDADAGTTEDAEAEAVTADAPALTADLMEYALGCAFGRWDIRFSTGERHAPELADPFVPLPVCPPGMLQNEKGLPAGPEDVPNNYPLRISWPGILVDDTGHAEDIEGRLREVLHVIWPERADAIEQEVCEILGVLSLREYFRKPNLFFADHLKRYSKSRRQAPIYWPLSTASGSYALWLYYHPLNDQTPYACVMDFVDPKLRQVNDTLHQLRAKGGDRSRDEERELERLQDFALELEAFRDELLRLAQLPWRPDLNDGVQITAAPLWKLFRLPKWQKTLKETWQKLEKGDYDWAHLAMSIWPERVVPKCVKDRSLAIVHGIEDLFWVEDTDRWRNLRHPEQEHEEQKQRRRSVARTNVRSLLAKIAQEQNKDLSTDEVGRRLAEGDWDDRQVALLLYPKRVAEKCWYDPVLERKLNVKPPAKRTKATQQKFINSLVTSGAPDLAAQVESAMNGRSAPFRVFWRELERGEHDYLDIALSLWPERVVDKCASDIGLAEHHGLQRFFWTLHPSGTWRRREPPEIEIANEVARRRGTSVDPVG